MIGEHVGVGRETEIRHRDRAAAIDLGVQLAQILGGIELPPVEFHVADQLRRGRRRNDAPEQVRRLHARDERGQLSVEAEELGFGCHESVSLWMMVNGQWLMVYGEKLSTIVH